MPAVTDDKAALWDQIEDNYWKSAKAVRAREDREQEAYWRTVTEPLKSDLARLYRERRELEDRLKEVNRSCFKAEADLSAREIERETNRKALAERRAAEDEVKRAWFKDYRQGGPDVESSEPGLDEDLGVDEANSQPASNDSSPPLVDEEVKEPGALGAREFYHPKPSVEDVPKSPQGTASQDRGNRQHIQEGQNGQNGHQPRSGGPHGESTGVEVYDGDGKLVGELHRIDLHSRSVDAILKFPIQRPVAIRPGKRFNKKTLDGVYEPIDGKGAKWLACHIQAAGEVQGQPCHTCVNNVGMFSNCVIVSGEDFPRCGNCEWNRLECHGASLQSDSAPQPTSQATPQSTSRPASRHASRQTPPNPPSRAGSLRSSRPSSRHGLGSDKGVVKQTSADQASPSPHEAPPRSTSGSSALQVRSKLGSQIPQPPGHPVRAVEESVKKTPTLMRRRSGKQSAGFQTPEVDPPDRDVDSDAVGDLAAEEPLLPEITKDVLALRDDGVVFTDPPCMRNVPLVKISPDHAYWEPDWVSVEDHIQGTLNMWLERHQQYVGDPKATPASRFLANRQINRGNATLQFLKQGDFHPYQIIGKNWITKNLLNYDTLHRMVQVLGELLKFKLDVTPSEWLRHRLHEIHVEKGDKFDLARTLSHMYHDPKVLQLRVKHGFGSIGRPSGSKTTAKASNTGTPKKELRQLAPAGGNEKSAEQATAGTRKRKDPHATPKKTPPAEPPATEERTPRSSQRKARLGSTDTSAVPQGGKAVSQQTHHHATRNPSKKQKLDQRQPETASTRSASIQDDLEYSGYTSQDSYSGDRVLTLDWRVYQVKTNKVTTNPAVTQYWHWVEKADDESNIFEHQVLKDVLPKNVTWGVYKDPYDFHLRLSELVNVSYAPNCQKLIIKTKPVPGVEHRGDVLAHFKRERTKRRFLLFMKKKGVKLVRTDEKVLESAWNSVNSTVLPGYDSE